MDFKEKLKQDIDKLTPSQAPLIKAEARLSAAKEKKARRLSPRRLAVALSLLVIVTLTALLLTMGTQRGERTHHFDTESGPRESSGPVESTPPNETEPPEESVTTAEMIGTPPGETSAPPETTPPNPPVEKYPDFEIMAFSLQDFIDQISDGSVQSAYKNEFFIQAANNGNLSFDGYRTLKIFYRIRRIDSGIISLDIYWHEKDCPSSVPYIYCEKFSLELVYFENGIDWVGLIGRPGYTRTETANLYMKEFKNNQTSYIYAISNQYFCRYQIMNDLADQNQIKEQLAVFCSEIADLLPDDDKTSLPEIVVTPTPQKPFDDDAYETSAPPRP